MTDHKQAIFNRALIAAMPAEVKEPTLAALADGIAPAEILAAVVREAGKDSLITQAVRVLIEAHQAPDDPERKGIAGNSGV